ncbi:hypothetical protein GUJ93_ZPchr0013g37395 [Zizania palustris]|uniref:Uncharacterized protein n=1 Tax=Zizania palustris TaxID=103762 RepID=A0A8J5X7W8_ZIZPA|nr:hypothetical protein GUJ93_ZPchr0013g37395 [Zizania palustris]
MAPRRSPGDSGRASRVRPSSLASPPQSLAPPAAGSAPVPCAAGRRISGSPSKLLLFPLRRSGGAAGRQISGSPSELLC